MLLVLAIVLGAVATLFFSTLTYSLRSFSRAKLADSLDAAGKSRWIEPTLDRSDDLAFVTAVYRLFANLLILLAVLRAFATSELWVQYLSSLLISGLICLVFAVAIPHALANHFSELAITWFVDVLHMMRWPLLPVTKVMHAMDNLVGRVAGRTDEPQPEEIEQEILSVVEEGEKEGVVDEQEREMIESVIEFRDTQVGQIMTTRPEIVALEIQATVAEVKQTLEESGHSRVPVYDGTLDQIVGILYARDLLKHVGQAGPFDIRTAVRPAIFVPESKPLRDLLQDFRAQKVHIAIVLDEYGGTAGLVTIEDILEELVGEISDEHEPQEPAMLKRIDENTFEADARLSIEQANRLMSLNLPTDAGYETIGGFVSTTLGRIPPKGTIFTHDNAKFTVLAAAPQRVDRVRVDLIPQPVPSPDGGPGPGT